MAITILEANRYLRGALFIHTQDLHRRRTHALAQRDQLAREIGQHLALEACHGGCHQEQIPVIPIGKTVEQAWVKASVLDDYSGYFCGVVKVRDEQLQKIDADLLLLDGEQAEINLALEAHGMLPARPLRAPEGPILHDDFTRTPEGGFTPEEVAAGHAAGPIAGAPFDGPGTTARG